MILHRDEDFLSSRLFFLKTRKLFSDILKTRNIYNNNVIKKALTNFTVMSLKQNAESVCWLTENRNRSPSIVVKLNHYHFSTVKIILIKHIFISCIRERFIKNLQYGKKLI